MLDSVKDVLNKDVDVKGILTKEVDVKGILTKEVDVKGILTKEVKVKEFLDMEIELTKLKQLLATEIKLKEFLVQEIDLATLLSNKSQNLSEADELDLSSKTITEDTVSSNKTKVEGEEDTTIAAKKDLPAFDYALIDSLNEDHKQIRFVFNRLMKFAVEKDYEKVSGQLEVFNQEIREHYQRTDTELYKYLKTYVHIKYPEREKAFAQLSFEMKNISIEIFYIISQSPNIPLSDDTYAAFMKEFMGVGKLLNERINQEKAILFKMYEQTHVVKSIS